MMIMLRAIRVMVLAAGTNSLLGAPLVPWKKTVANPCRTIVKTWT